LYILKAIVGFCKIDIEGAKLLGVGLGEHKTLKGLFLGIFNV